MASVAANVAMRMNGVEIALLILAAYFHDQGMVVDAAELAGIQSTDEWKLHEQNWIADHPNFGETISKLSDPLITTEERLRISSRVADLHAAMFTDFIRGTHGERSARLLQQKFGSDPRLVVNLRSLVDLLALICVSHVRPAEAIAPANGYRFDELVGTTRVNSALLAYILRLADILDFDRERTPDSLYRAIQFNSEISLLEWQKHRSVTGWEVAADRILFAAECEHPAYERAVRAFFEWIDGELVAVEAWGRSLPAEFQHHRLELPQHVDSTRVGPRIDPITREPIYQYFDLEFSIARDEIVKLLMTDRLYTNKSLFVRELLQNSLDALRHRRALYQSNGVTVSDLRVEFEHVQDAGFDVVRCRDNGVGMDERIVTRFLTRVGRSYYRSPEFDQERARFRDKGSDFDPCARFGIGFMSCFMFGDEITIRTRRDNGVGREHGKPLIAEITGLSGIVVIRPGREDQPVGTTVEVRGRRKSFTVDRWSDPVHLVDVLTGYALAVEFPIVATCAVPSIAERVEIDPGAASHPHPLERSETVNKVVFTAVFSAADSRLAGELRTCMLVDEHGLPAAANKEASVEIEKKPNPQSSEKRIAFTSGAKPIGAYDVRRFDQVCCDGILVVGEPGRHGRNRFLGHTSLQHSFGGASFLLDARGDLKPTLTPARTPPDSSFREDPTWARLFDAAAPAYSEMLSRILERCLASNDPARFWTVAEAYDLDLYYLPLIDFWHKLRFPTVVAGGAITWMAASALGNPLLRFPNEEKQPLTLTLPGGKSLEIPSAISDLQLKDAGIVTELFFERLMTGMSTISSVSPTELELKFREPDPRTCLNDLAFREVTGWRWFFHFAGDLARAVCVTGSLGFANADHAVVRFARANQRSAWDEYSPLERIMVHLTFGHVHGQFDLELPATSWGAHFRKELGLLYQAVDWGDVDASLRPPYAVFRPGFGIETLTEAHFAKWSDLAVTSEADDE